MKRLHFSASYSTFFVGLFMFLIFTATEKVLGQNLVATGRLTNLTITTSAGQTYNWQQFPTFTAPSGKKVIFSGAGRLSSETSVSSAFSNFSIFDRGFTHLNHNQMTLNEKQGGTNSTAPSSVSWTANLPKSKRAYISSLGEWNNDSTLNLKWVLGAKESGVAKEDPFYDYYENSTAPNMQWGIKALPGYKLSNGDLVFGSFPTGYGGLDSYDIICWDIEIGGNRTSASTSDLFSGSPGLSLSPLLSKFQQATANRYNYLLQQTKAQTSSTWVGSYDTGAPFNTYGQTPRSAYDTSPNMDVWSQTVNNADATNRNMPSSLNGTTMSDHLDFITPSAYFQIAAEFSKGSTADHYSETSGVKNWLANLLGTQEVNTLKSSKPRIPFYWLFREEDTKNYPTQSNEIPSVAAEANAIFPWFTGISGLILWDDQAIGVNTYRVYSGYEHFLHGLYRLFYNHKDMLEGSPTYLQKDTEFKVTSISNGNSHTIESGNLNKWTSDNDIGGSNKSDANIMKTKKLPFVRAIIKDCDILVTACYPYADANTQTAVTIKYDALGWSGTFTLNGDEVYLGRATMKPSLDNVTVDGSSNVSTPIFIDPGSHTIYVAPSTNNTTYSYSVIYPSNSSVQLYPNGNYCQFNTNGATGSFYIRISATNSCGTTTRDLVFVVQSGYRAYSNPTKDYLSITFDNAKNLEGLPDSIELLPETSTKAVKGVVLKDIYDKNAFKNGDTVEFDVRTLTKGTYYLHLKYTTPASILAQYKDAKQKSKTDVVRVIIN